MPILLPRGCHAAVVLAVVGLWTTVTREVSAADPPPAKPAAANAIQDPDVALQGEFVGPVASSPSEYQRWGLQVNPVGDGRFEAIQYPGGLPGEPTHRPSPVTLVGKRCEKFLVLSGGPWAVFVEPDHCLLLDREGHVAGRLERIRRQSPTLGARPPKNAIVLFDGKDTNQFTRAQMTGDGLLMEGAYLKAMYQDFNLHVEFMLPYLPSARDQGRANSGVYLESRYEVQILDSFAQQPLFNGCGSFYRFRKPDVNMCLPPLVWQTYDIAFTAPRWTSDNTKLANARASVWQNGVRVQNNVELESKTGAGKPEEPAPLPTYLQDHGNPVRFRNVWIIDRGALPLADFPILAKAPGKKHDKQKPGDQKQHKPKAAQPKRDQPKPGDPEKPKAAPKEPDKDKPAAKNGK